MKDFQWKCEPAAENLLLNYFTDACTANEQIAALQGALHRDTSTRLFDWVDHLLIGHTPGIEAQLEATGFVIEGAGLDYQVYSHPRAKLPSLLVTGQPSGVRGVAVLVESIADFLMVRGLSLPIAGSLFSGYRSCQIATERDVTLLVVERRGMRSMEPLYEGSQATELYLEALEAWKSRPRQGDEEKNMREALLLAEELVAALGRDKAACVVAEVEREYWQRRNRAAQLQKNRQDQLGMGWANHDHHTFRSSRRFFPSLVRLFEILGFHCRERFYAGQEAGWGAQVMENPRAGLVLFLDVDLGEEEIVIDFAHLPLEERPQLGTIGLWCALHGDSILQAGMHHLEAQFFFEELTRDLAPLGVAMMDPFSSFPYLKQAFTQGEFWPVSQERLEGLVKSHKISEEQAKQFRALGAIGSHLENLQRREGYKGFNQKNVSFIIRKTDPRAQTTTTLQGD